ncbi:hypothetical protein MBT42_36345 [Streptomyces sp. MBT42]|uniref:hypothetical protein n=1 Tax=Streptomyces sp. MBT42 TaxID=1488373 RepID=UPI001E567F6F|nr:hypothetical protein [Streptomyces sp. MBT42]MCD2469008.1 hypothetical protein [Streptomyces sp. MBT42]
MVASTADSDEDWGQTRHWLVDTTGTHGFLPIDYPMPVSGEPTALGSGVWSTLSEARDALYVWGPRVLEG